MNDNSSLQRALTPQEVADILKISKNTVYELIKRGELNGYRVGKKVRVDLSDVENYKNQTRQSAVKADAQAAETDIPFFYDETVKGFVICGQDVLLDVLSRELEQKVKGLRTLRSYLGSYNGLYALYRGEVQIATAHLWDSETDTYNISYVNRMLPGTPVAVYHLVGRSEGFYVKKGNPKDIHGWEDLKRKDLVFVNREQGSGARVLLDGHLQKFSIDSKDITGYKRECTSHLMVASTVSRGGADFGLGIRNASQQVADVDFIPLKTELLDLVFKKEDEDKPGFRAVVEIIQSKKFAEELSSLGGYDLRYLGKKQEMNG